MDSHYSRQWQTWLLIRQTNRNTYATISNSFFSHIRDIRHTITNLLHQKGSNCFKKKNTPERERVRETGAPTWGPNPRGVNQESTTTEKKRGRKGRNPAIEDRGIKTSSVPSESSSGQGHNEFFFPSHRIFFSNFLFATWLTSIQLRFFDTWRKRHSISVESSWVRSSSYLNSYGPGLLTPRSPWAHLSRLRFKSKQSTNLNQVIRRYREHNGQFQSHNTPSGSRNR